MSLRRETHETEIKEAFSKGYIEYEIEGETRRVNARDPFLAYALIVMTHSL